MTEQSAQSRGGAPAAIILAAGQGTRMQSDLPKVLHEVGGRPMVLAVIDACREAGCGRIVLVVGYQQERVRAAVEGSGESGDVEFVVQAEQLGTGHAVACCRGAFEGEAGEVFVLCGDGPLIRPATLGAVLERHRGAGAAATLATSVIEDPSGYGRVVRDGSGRFERIVEQKNATAEELSIREVNPSYYCFSASKLFAALERVERNEKSGEYYLTDVPALLLGEGERVEVIDAVPPEDVLSINTPADLAQVDAIYRRRAGGRGRGADVPREGGS